MNTKQNQLKKLLKPIVESIVMEEKQKKSLIGKKVKITSDNENYEPFIGKILIVTDASIGGRGYDDSMYPEALCSFKLMGSNKEVPFSLYEYEFEIIRR